MFAFIKNESLIFRFVIHIYGDHIALWLELYLFNSSHCEQFTWGHKFIDIVIFVAQIYHFRDARLNDQLGTFIARKQCNIDRTTTNWGRVFVEYGIHFGMANVWIFCVKFRVGITCPRQHIVRATNGHPVITNTNNFVFIVNNTSTNLSKRIKCKYKKVFVCLNSNLSIRIFGAHSGKMSNGHKIFGPFQIIISLCWLWWWWRVIVVCVHRQSMIYVWWFMAWWRHLSGWKWRWKVSICLR